ncbi:MAG: histidine phosphatase family protein, partial [Longimicrobiales bacterium]
VRPPSGETLAELETRVLDWLRGLNDGDHVVAFTHGGPIRVVLALARRAQFHDVRSLPIAPGAVVHCIVAAEQLCGAT